MARYDKYEPRAGGFRAPLEALIAAADVGKIYAVAVNASGRVIRTGIAATADIVGVICAVRPMNARDVIDVMTAGEILEATETAGTAFTLGLLAYGHLDGTVDDTSTSGKVVGRTVEEVGGTRLVVRVAQG
jgi:hypothetical protein